MGKWSALFGGEQSGRFRRADHVTVRSFRIGLKAAKAPRNGRKLAPGEKVRVI